MSFVHAPNVECALGKHTMVQNAMRIGFESALTERVKQLGENGFTSADEMAEWTGKMLLLSGGKNSIKWTNDGTDGTPLYWPSVVVWRPAHKAGYYLDGAGDDFHPAFKAGANMYPGYWAGKYAGPYVTSNSKTLLLSLPNFDGKTNALTGAKVDTNYDTSVTYGTAGGNGSHSITNTEYMEIALDCYNSGFQPKGNNSYGKDASDPEAPEYYGVPSSWWDGKTLLVLNGLGPLSWFHDGSPWGVWGMNGNFNDVTTGFRQKAGEIQVLANNDAALSDCDHSDATGPWKGILQDGSLVDPGTEGTLKYDALPVFTISTSVTTRTTTSKYNSFGTVAAADGVTIPKIAQLLGIAPIGTAAQHGSDSIYIRNDAEGTYSETLARRGGYWARSTQAGVFFLSLDYHRSRTSGDYGSRLAFL
jgi:sulfatase modifying factor 1